MVLIRAASPHRYSLADSVLPHGSRARQQDVKRGHASQRTGSGVGAGLNVKANDDDNDMMMFC